MKPLNPIFERMRLHSKQFIFALMGVLLFMPSQAQELPFNSGEVIRKAIELHNKGEYKEAIEHFLTVEKSDTNYNWMLAEICLSYLEDSSYKEAIQICNTGLLRNIDNIDQFYNIKGTALDRGGDYKSALKVFEKAVERCPASYLLRYNQGVTYENAGFHQEAFEIYKSVLKLNPYHVGSHLKLALMAAKKGELSRAGLSIAMALSLGAKTTQAVNYLILGESILKGEFEKEDIKLDFGKGNYQKTDLILRNRIALNKAYKLQSKLDFQIYRQLQVLFETMEYDETSEDFWMKYYVPYFLKLREEEYFGAYTYYCSRGIGNPKTEKLLKKNKSKAEEYGQWSLIEMKEFFGQNKEFWDGEERELSYWFYRGNRLQAKGNKLNDKNEGYWEFYHWSGNLSSKGRFKDGKRVGEWYWYHPNDRVDERLEFDEAGKLVGVYESYSIQGKPIQKREYKEGQLSLLNHYFPMGNVNTNIPYELGERNGAAEFYHGTDSARVRCTYLDGAVDGPYYEFYLDGKKSGEFFYTEGGLNGAYLEFHTNGETRTKGNYLNGLATGDWEYFHENGEVQKRGEFKDGNSLGLWEEFYRGGIKESRTEFDQDGNKEGKLKQYDQNGKLVFDLSYKKDELMSFRNYDADGKMLREAQTKSGKLWLEVDRVDGSKWFTGNYSRNQKEGEWNYYDEYGIISAIELYSAGELSGLYRSFYPNGQLKYSVNYLNGDMNGYYEEFHANGQLKDEGWMTADGRSGIWKAYYSDGTLASKKFYIDGSQEDVQEFYNEDGKKYLENLVQEGYLLSLIEYDLVGDTLDVHPILDTIQVVEYHHPDGSVRMRGSYRNGYGNGMFQWLNGLAEVETEGLRLHGMDESEWKWYYPGKKLKTVGTFIRDERTGPWKWCYREGGLKSEGAYQYGKQVGDWKTYYPNGKLSSLKPYLNGERHGKSTYFSEEGDVYLVRFHEYGKLISFSYEESKGALVDAIPIVGGSAKIESRYPNGKISASFEYVNSFLEGAFTIYYPDGKKMEESTFEHGELQGRSTEYYSNGNERSVEEYYFGNRHGVCTYYHRNGKLKEESNFLLGRRYGEQKLYDSEGNLLKTEHYHDGSLIGSK